MGREQLRLIWRILGYSGGGGLVALAIWMGFSQLDFSVLASSPRLPLAAMAVAVLANLVLTSLLFWVITCNFDAVPQVGLWRMNLLISASVLLNYLPFRPGLIGRAAYLKAHHRLPLRQSGLVWLIVAGISAFVFGVTVGALLMGMPEQCMVSMSVAMLVLAVFSLLVGPLGARWLGRPLVAPWSWMAIKVADMGVQGVRLWLAMAMVGESIPLGEAVVAVPAAAAAGMFVSLLGITPNGLGLREWAITGLLTLSTPMTGSHAVAVALIDRAVELLVILPAGAYAAYALGHHLPRHQAGG